jgi:hypothetical protein
VNGVSRKNSAIGPRTKPCWDAQTLIHFPGPFYVSKVEMPCLDCRQLECWLRVHVSESSLDLLGSFSSQEACHLALFGVAHRVRGMSKVFCEGQSRKVSGGPPQEVTLDIRWGNSFSVYLRDLCIHETSHVAGSQGFKSELEGITPGLPTSRPKRYRNVDAHISPSFIAAILLWDSRVVFCDLIPSPFFS